MFKISSLNNPLFEDRNPFSLFERTIDGLTSKYKISEKEGTHFLEILTAGIEKSDITIEAENGELTVRNNKESFWTPKFNQKYKIPANSDTKKISAKMENGILKISVPSKAKIESYVVSIED